jgi:hypothetical protein
VTEALCTPQKVLLENSEKTIDAAILTFSDSMPGLEVSAPGIIIFSVM